MVALAGAGPWPQITSVRPRFTSCTITGTSPPGPLRCGSTTCNVNAMAAPPSNALPPFSSVAMPTAVAIQCVEVTTPKVPSSSGRVVNGSGLMLLMGSPGGWELARAIEHRASGVPTGVSRHVWTAPFRQGLFGVAANGSGSGHVYGLEMRPVTAGPDGDRRSNSNHSGVL